MKKVYMIDDEATKHSFLHEILNQLNESLSEEEKFEDGFNGLAENALFDADLLIKAANDPQGICLVDLEIRNQIDNAINLNYRNTGLAMQVPLREAGRISELEQINKIKRIMTAFGGAEDYFLIPSAILAISKAVKTKSLIISNRMGGAVIEALKKEGFASELFPYSEDSKGLVDNVVRAIKTQWFGDEWLSFDEFMDRLEVMTHSQIHERGEANDFLRRFLKLTKKEFLDAFGNPGAEEINHGATLKTDVVEALKNISGLTDDEGGKYLGREAALDSAWLLALGVYRQLFPNNNWQAIFKAEQLSLEQVEFDRHLNLHPPQKNPQVRRRTLKFYVEMCGLLFKDRKLEFDSSRVESVELTPHFLFFTLNFPAKKLHDRIINEARYMLGDEGDIGHNTSASIWRFYLSSSFADSPSEGSGVFGVHPKINVFARGANKTEVRFG